MTPTQWQHHVQDWQRSRQSKQAYCRDQDLSYSRFLYWSNKSTKPMPESVSTKADLLPVMVTETQPQTDSLGVVEFPNGTKLYIHRTELLSSLPALLKG